MNTKRTAKTAPTRAAIYVRLSDHRGEDDASLSPESQEQACRALATMKGWDVVDVVRDLDVSATAKGRRLDRPGLAELLRRAGKDFDVIVARDLSRLARSTVDFLTLNERAAAAGATLATTKENLDMSTATGRLVGTILAAFAEMEAENVGYRVAAHRAAAADAGRYAGGKAAFGLRRVDNPDGPGSILTPDPDEAAIIARAVDLLLVDRLSLYRAAIVLTDEGALPRSGKPWTGNALSRVLRNPSLRGYVVHRGALVTDADGLPRRFWTPVLRDEDWLALEPILTARAAPEKRAQRSTILSGIAVCALCGGVLHNAVQAPKNGARYDVLRCGGKSAGRDCVGVSMKRAHLEDYVLREFTARYGALAEERVVERPADVAGLADVRQAIADTTDAMRRPGADIPALAERLTTLAARRDELAALPAVVVERVTTGRSIAAALADEGTPLAERQAILARALPRVEVGRGQRGRRVFDPERVRLRWRADSDEQAYRDALRDAAEDYA